MSGGDPNDVVHRGVRWQRARSGALRWRADDAGEWVRYRVGQDAPPRPPGWEVQRRGLLPSGLILDRPSWRTPYRIVPVVLLLSILGIGLAQALTGSGGQAAAETRAAQALVDRCLASVGAVGGRPDYGAKGVACTSPGASVRVTEALPGTPGSPPCPRGTTTVVLAYPGVRHPHQLCTVPAHA